MNVREKKYKLLFFFILTVIVDTFAQQNTFEYDRCFLIKTVEP